MSEPLTAAETVEYHRLWEARREAEKKLWDLKAKARTAIKLKNAQERIWKSLTAKWLPLAERKHATQENPFKEAA